MRQKLSYWICIAVLASTCVMVACGGEDYSPCDAIKAKLASCESGAVFPDDMVCGAALYDQYDRLMNAGCGQLKHMTSNVLSGKADWWGGNGCDPGFHSCNMYFCCQDDPEQPGPQGEPNHVPERENVTPCGFCQESCFFGQWCCSIGYCTSGSEG